MVSLAEVLQLGVAVYVLFGSTSWGYIMMRVGWPNIRGFPIDYKSGWSLVFGIVFSALVLASAFAAQNFLGTGMGFLEIVFLNATGIFLAGALFLTLKRKLLSPGKVNVSVPKRVVSANVVAKRAVERIAQKPIEKPAEEEKISISTLKDKLEKIGQKKSPETAQKPAQKSEAVILAPRPLTGKILPEFIPKAQEKEIVRQAIAKEAPIGERNVDAEKKRNVDAIIGALERHIRAKEQTDVATRSEMEERVEKSKQYIKENIREKIGGELEEQMMTKNELEEKKVSESMPKSARLLKELLKETKGE
ncbi:MAG: hypothetical protein NUV67_01995 [archaeon]|nr:hypothetical protein [archaeon]